MGHYLPMELNMLTILPLFVVGAISRVAAYGRQDQRPLAAINDNIHSLGWGSVRIRVRAIISQVTHSNFFNT